MASKYQGKKQGKKQGKAKGKAAKSVVVRDERAPKNLYTSDCCGELAKKTACVPDFGAKFEDRKATLGHWRCSQCRRVCKVTVSRNKEGIIPFRPKALAPPTGSLPLLLAFAEALVPGSVDRIFENVHASA